MVHDIEREATKPLHRDAIAAEVLTRKGWAHDPDLLDTVADKVKDVRKRTVSCSEASLEPIGSQKL